MLAILLFTLAADPLPAPRFVSLPTPKFVAKHANCTCADCKCVTCDGSCSQTATEWVVTLDGRTFRVGKSVDRETAVRLAKEVAGEKATTSTVKPSLTVVPPGSHAHRKTDGTTVIHGNENVGNAAAHAGIAKPWVRTAEAGQAVPAPAFIPLQSYFPAASSCPNGQCPNAAPVKRGLFR